MSPANPNTGFDRLFVRNMVEAALRIGLLLVLLVMTYDIIRPFIIPIVWGGIIAIAAFPLARRLEKAIGGRRGLAATLLTLFFVLALVIPTYQVTEALVGATKTISTHLSAGDLQIPGPNPAVAEWPVVGKRVYEAWSLAHENTQEALLKVAPHLKALATKAASTIGATLASVGMFVISLLIAGAFITYAEASGNMAHRLFVRLGGEKPGGEWASMCVATVRSVLLGVVGVAVIQTLLCAIGLFALGIPGSPIWCALILFLAIAQLPTIIVVGPIIAYAFANYATTPATIFTVWMLIAGFSDTFLKPMLMGRGLSIPMPIILIGAIGGMLTAGIIGLFSGAVVLAIWYQLFLAWLEQQPNPEPGTPAPADTSQ
ncbi:MAG: AI-2E family transporter [Halieaceae bacterium]|nr:AI-2E family transporter [Halieaceae bacterium]